MKVTNIIKQQSTIELCDLSVGYKNRKKTHIVASHLNANIKKGELTCLLGANGIGKSTLLRTISAFQPILDGDITIGGSSITSYSEKELSMLVSVVLTDRIELRNMSVRELISIGRSPYTGFWGKLTSEDVIKIDKAISLVNVENLADRLINNLSDGERQKVMIAKALSQDTPIILLDEPTAFLDFPSKVEMMQLLHRLSRETQKTIFLSTHDLELALQIADKIWLMDDNTQLHVGTPEDLSLNGSLSNFFARKGIIFDKETGLFRIENEFYRTIRLKGHGQHYSMIRKALLRNRILAARNVESHDLIEIIDKQIFISLHNQPRQYAQSIQELLNIILANHEREI